MLLWCEAIAVRVTHVVLYQPTGRIADSERQLVLTPAPMLTDRNGGSSRSSKVSASVRGTQSPQVLRATCGFTREEYDAVYGIGVTGVRG